jgi:CheY-like chemotaxis protein
LSAGKIVTDAPSVLLVEDSPDDAFFFQRALRRAGVPCQVRHVLNGLEALEVLNAGSQDRSKLPDAVFLDLKMPVMNGFELLEWLIQQRFPAIFPIYVLSGSNQQDDRTRAAALGASDYIVKPIGSAELASRLRSLKAKDET